MAEYDSTTARFDILRKRLQGEKAKAASDQEEAIKRRYAAQGMLQSGAYLKSQEEGAQKLEEATQKGLQDISFAEEGERQRVREVEEARKYQTSEREASQSFAAGESQKQRLFSRELFDADMAFKEKVQSQNFGLAEKEFEESKRSNRANLAIALKTAGLNDYEVENLFATAGEMLGHSGSGSGGGQTQSSGGSSDLKSQVHGGIQELYSSGNVKGTEFIQSILRGYGYKTALDELNKLKSQGGRMGTPIYGGWGS